MTQLQFNLEIDLLKLSIMNSNLDAVIKSTVAIYVQNYSKSVQSRQICVQNSKKSVQKVFC